MPISQQTLSTADHLHHAFVAACSAHTSGRLEEALKQYLVLLGYLPNSVLLDYNIGLVYFAFDDFDQAIHHFSRAAINGPEDGDTLFNLALCQKKTGNRAAAIATYLRVLTVDPDQADCLYNLGGCYRDLRDDDQAIACYRRVLVINPGYLAAANNLAYLHHRSGNFDQAVLYYTQVLEQRPEDESVRYLRDSLLGTPLDHAPDAYVRNFFDTYAEGFERNLVEELGYDNPRQLFECLCNSGAGATVYEHGLDLGCGTGLSGLSFKGLITVLDGVDLSHNMLIQAAQKGCYTTLYPESIMHHLDATKETYDFFLATDVFIYVGDLIGIFTAAQAVARPAALFCFSTEHLDAAGYQLLPTGRFAYSRTYIHSLAAATGWTVLALEPTLVRKERDAWIAGDLWILRVEFAHKTAAISASAQGKGCA